MGIKNSNFYLSIIAAMLLINPASLKAQVVNDNIEQRIHLPLNEPYSSKTDSCTLDYECLNLDIIDNCIKYHNDQWFEIKPNSSTTHYININQQNCRDILGVQIAVLSGKACQPETYQLINCTSLGNQDDVFIALDSLEAGETYLVNVDGYLHDFCAFQIEFSDQRKGMPLQPETKSSSQHSLTEDIVNIEWTVDESIADDIKEYHVMRRFQTEAKSQLRRIKYHEKTSLGDNIPNYSTSDTLPNKGSYEYKILAITFDSTFHLIDQFSHVLKLKKKTNTYSNQFLTIHKTFKKPTSMTMMVEDILNNEIIYFKEMEPSKEHHKRLFLGEFLAKGITQFRVTTQDGRTRKKEVKEYDWNDYLTP